MPKRAAAAFPFASTERSKGYDVVPGSSEAVLSKALAGDHTPYRWLCRAVSAEARRVLDLGCGSGPVAKELAGPDRLVVGLDLSAAELAGSPRPVVRADAAVLPFGAAAFDVVTCSMGLMVFESLADVLAEVARVLRPGGVFAATVPAVRPVRRTDVRTLTTLAARLRATPSFPAGTELAGLREALGTAGFDVLESQRERYAYVVRSAADADELVRSLYLPEGSAGRREAAAAWLAGRAEDRGEVEVAIPVRRVVAMRG